MKKDKKETIISFAKQAEERRKQENLTNDETLKWFSEQMIASKISVDGWFSVDEEIRKHYESYDWFWIIRTIRNNQNSYGWKLPSQIKAPKVHVKKQSEDRWMVWANFPDGAKCADIVGFEDHGILKTKKRFRVDVSGRTVESMIDHFQTAKAIAIAEVKKG